MFTYGQQMAQYKTYDIYWFVFLTIFCTDAAVSCVKEKEKKSQAKSSNSKVEKYIQSRAASVQSIANFLFKIKKMSD